MFRWNDLEDNEYYRDIFIPINIIKIKCINAELDLYAYKFLGTELETYKIMDSNFIAYIENRGNLSKLKTIKIPTES